MTNEENEIKTYFLSYENNGGKGHACQEFAKDDDGKHISAIDALSFMLEKIKKQSDRDGEIVALDFKLVD